MANIPTVRVTKEFMAPARTVFNAWLDIDMLSQWMFGAAVRDEEIIKMETDARVDGRFSFVVKRGDDVINHVGKYMEIDPYHRLVFTWGIEGVSVDESVVTIMISPTPTGCRLELTHVLAPGWEEYTKRTEEGWSYMLGKLQDLLRP